MWDSFPRLPIRCWCLPRKACGPSRNYAHQLSQLAGRLHSSDPGPAPPPALVGLDAEVVVLLSAQNLMPFAWPYGDDLRYFVAVPSGDEREDVTRNVIAHELGHVLGLKHIREPGVLMCQPCDTSSARSRDQPDSCRSPTSTASGFAPSWRGLDHDIYCWKHLDPQTLHRHGRRGRHWRRAWPLAR